MTINDYLEVLESLRRELSLVCDGIASMNRSSTKPSRGKAKLEEERKKIEQEMDAILYKVVDDLEGPYDPKEDDE